MIDPLLLNTNPVRTLEGLARVRESRGAGPHISLVVFYADQIRVVRLSPGTPLVLGRDPSTDLPINDDSVSRRHASFQIDGEVVTVKDLGSTNRTKLNGAPIESAVMSLGDEVTAGMVTISLHALAPAQTHQPGLGTHDQFLVSLDEEVDRAKTFGRVATVVMLRHQGDTADMGTLRAKIRSVDRLALYGDGTFELLLPERRADEAAALMRFLASALSEPHIGLATYPDDGTSAEALLEAARDAMHRASSTAPIQHAQSSATATTRPSVKAGLISVSPAMQTIVATVSRVANSVIPVLVRGETGTGKEVLARAIHDASPRAKQRLVCFNCGAVPSTLVESVLFGHERGAFTGATASTRGVFEEASGSTVLLDEVAELSASAQAALLRVLESKEVRRVGAQRDVTVDVRIIAATHRDLEAMVRAGTFREDLMYRLNAMTLELPPLRERPEEIVPLTERFLALSNRTNGREVKGLDAEAMRLLLGYPWPGNIRELRNAVDHSVVVAQGAIVQVTELPRRIRDFAATVKSEALGATAPTSDLREGVQRYEVQVILQALRACNGNRTEAARRLHIPIRTLSHKIRQYGIKKLGFGLDDDSAE